MCCAVLDCLLDHGRVLSGLPNSGLRLCRGNTSQSMDQGVGGHWYRSKLGDKRIWAPRHEAQTSVRPAGASILASLPALDSLR